MCRIFLFWKTVIYFETAPQKNDNPRFKGISKNQSYYINKQGELVICFDQFEVAPGYMGNPTFTIKNDLLDDYFK